MLRLLIEGWVRLVAYERASTLAVRVPMVVLWRASRRTEATYMRICSFLHGMAVESTGTLLTAWTAKPSKTTAELLKGVFVAVLALK